MKKKIEKNFETFNPREYLSEYYATVGFENKSLLEFFVEAYQGIPKNSLMLEFGGGPTIYQLISAAKHTKEIYFSDHLNRNLNEVKLWRSASLNSFDWNEFFRQSLILEGVKKVTKSIIEKRKKLVRRKITKFMHCDAFNTNPLGLAYRSYFDVVSFNFVAESITNTHKSWKQVFSNIHSLLKKDGHLIMTAIKEARFWHVGNKLFPAASISEHHINTLLKELGFKEELLMMRSIPAENIDNKGKGIQGYQGMIFLRAKRK